MLAQGMRIIQGPEMHYLGAVDRLGLYHHEEAVQPAIQEQHMGEGQVPGACMAHKQVCQQHFCCRPVSTRVLVRGLEPYYRAAWKVMCNTGSVVDDKVMAWQLFLLPLKDHL